jgi:flagellar FliJ protein
MHPATLDRLIEQARERLDAAQLRFAGLQRQLEQSRAHLELLRRYAGEYQARAAWQPGDTRDPGAQQNEIVFLARLQLAIDTQVREVELRQSGAQAAGIELAASQRRHESLQILRRRRLQVERQAQARREQKLMDEFAQRAHERSALARHLDTPPPAEGTP